MGSESEAVILRRHVHPLWSTSSTIETPLTPFLEEIRTLVLDYAARIQERQRLPQVEQIVSVPGRGPAKIGCGVRQIEDAEVPMVSWDKSKMVSLPETNSLRWCSPV